MLNQYLNKVSITKSENTYKAYKNALSALFPTSDIDYSSNYLLNKIKSWQGLSRNTISYRLTVYATFLNFVHNKINILEYNELIEICKSYEGEEKIPSVAHKSDMAALLKIASVKYKLILLLLYQCSLRVSEVVNIDLDDIKDSYIVIKNTKGKRDRIAPITKDIREAIDNYMAIRHNTCDALFTSVNGRLCKNAVQKRITDMCNRCNIDGIHCHSLRHGGITSLLRNGVDLESIRLLAGHASLQTTSKYLHIETSELVSKVNSVYN